MAHALAIGGFGEMTVAALLDGVRHETAAPGGGSVACIAVAMAAALLEKAARQSEADFDEVYGAVAQAAALRRGAVRLSLEDAEAFETADKRLKNPLGADQWTRDNSLARALDVAAAVPLAISDVAADTVELGTLVLTITDDDRKADVVTALYLGEAACNAARHLVEVNLVTTAGDERLLQASAAAARAQEARHRGLKEG